jgi:hypothetical protein
MIRGEQLWWKRGRAALPELELVPGSKRIRERTIEAVLAAARRLEAAMLIPWAEALADWLIDLPYRRKSRKARREVEAILAETPKQTYERLMREGIDG